MRSFAFEFKAGELNKKEIEKFIKHEIEFCCKDPKGLEDAYIVGINKKLLNGYCKERKNGDGRAFPSAPLITIIENTLYFDIIHYYKIMKDFIRKVYEKYKDKIIRIYDDYNTDYLEDVYKNGIDCIYNG